MKNKINLNIGGSLPLQVQHSTLQQLGPTTASLEIIPLTPLSPFVVFLSVHVQGASLNGVSSHVPENGALKQCPKVHVRRSHRSRV